MFTTMFWSLSFVVFNAGAEPPTPISEAERKAFVEQWKAAEQAKQAAEESGPVVCTLEAVNASLPARRQVWMVRQLGAGRAEFSFQTLSPTKSMACAWAR